MAQALKVGDRVRGRAGYLKKIGVGKVVGIPTEGRVVVLFDDHRFPAHGDAAQKHPGAGTFAPSQLEKIDPEPKFKIGDRARDPFSKGVVTVIATDAHTTHPIRARYADGSLGLWKESELTKIGSIPFKLERGDRVVNIKTGREGEVIRGFVYDVKPPFQAPVPVKAVEEYEEHHSGTYDLIKKDAPW